MSTQEEIARRVNFIINEYPENSEQAGELFRELFMVLRNILQFRSVSEEIGIRPENIKIHLFTGTNTEREWLHNKFDATAYRRIATDILKLSGENCEAWVVQNSSKHRNAIDKLEPYQFVIYVEPD